MTEITRIEDREWYKRFRRSEFEGTHNNAMFKGIPFIFVSDTFTSGRRIIEHEYPQQDIPYAEDMGKRIRNIEISGILLGDDYLTQRDNLLIACEESGPGELIHPYYGIFDVVCKNIQITNVNTETRLCRFSIVVSEAGKAEFITGIIDTTAKTILSVNDTLTTSRNVFIDTYNKVQKILATLDGKKKMLRLGLLNISNSKDKLVSNAAFRQKITGYIDDIDGLVLSGEDLFDSILDSITYGIFDSTIDTAIDLKDMFSSLLDTLNFEGNVSNSSDDSDLIQQTIQQITLATITYIAANVEYESVNEASYFRNMILNKVDEIILSDIDDELLQNLLDLKSAITQDIDFRSINLPILTTYISNKVIPTLVLSYQLYGNVSNEQDIINRNNLYLFNFGGEGEDVTANILGIQHPGFIPGGESLEVLLNV